MARIRTVKPEFWEDEVVASLSRDARLLFIATFNMADDEGLLRWTPPYIKAQAFIYDDDVDIDFTTRLMAELSDAGLLFPYVAGKVQQRLAYIVNFHKHQKINRPQPSKLPPPSIQNGDVKQMYVRRDAGVCHLCKGLTTTDPDERKLWPSLDHLTPRAAGGSDYPSNLAVSHHACNCARRDRPIEDFKPPVSVTGRSLTDSVNGSVSSSPTPPESFTAGRGREGKGREGGAPRDFVTAATEPPLRCSRHVNSADDKPCRPCGDARRAHDAWVRAQRARPTPVPGPGSAPRCSDHPQEAAHACRSCAADRKAAAS